MKIELQKMPPSAQAANQPVRQSDTYWRSVARRLGGDKTTIVVTIGIVFLFMLAIFAPLFATYDPNVGRMALRLKPAGTEGHWLGTDELGRDLWSRLVYGSRLSLLSALAPVVAAVLIGGSLGVAAGYFGKVVNSVIMRCMDVLFAFPSLLLALAIGGALGPGLGNTIVALTIVFIPSVVRVTESVTKQVADLNYIEAARTTDAGALMIIGYHVLPNILGPVLVYSTSLISMSVILASGLSFLGLGASPPNAEWGLMLNSLRQAMYVIPVEAILPGAMIFATSMCFNLLSDGLRSAMDVRI